MGLTWQGKLLLAVVVAALGSSVFSGRNEQEAHGPAVQSDLTGLSGCALAVHYLDWRLGFLRQLGDATEIRGQQLTTFLSHNGRYMRAADAARRIDDTPVLRALAVLNMHDSDRSKREVADPGPFFRAFINDCPAEAMAFAARL